MFHCQLLGCPLFGSNTRLFPVPGFIVSLVGIKLKKEEEEGRRKRYKGKENRNRTRKKEREEEDVKRKKNKNIIIIKNYLKKKSLLLASNWLSQY